jgi:predicted ATPase
MIRGLSGTGKSTLAKQFMEDLEQKSQQDGGPTKPFFLSGKYDELSRADPFSAIVEAFSGFASSLVKGEHEELESVRQDIKTALGTEANVLATVVPDLRVVTYDEDDDSTVSVFKENAWNRLRHVFQTFSNAISTKARPVVMFLDDLQWCDEASFGLIQSLLADCDLRYFMFVGCYRSDEVEGNLPLKKLLEFLEERGGIETIELVNFSIGELNAFIGDALGMEAEETQSLTDAVYRKTSGNIFYTMQVLEELQRKSLLSFSRVTFQWEWYLDDIQIDDLLSEDVIQAVTAKIRSAPKKLQKALVIAAYTRSTFDIDTLQKLMELDGCPVESQEMIELLDKAVLDGHLSNITGLKTYSFAHDRILQAGKQFQMMFPTQQPCTNSNL